MKTTRHSVSAERQSADSPAVVYAVVSNLQQLPSWWSWREPHPRLELDEHHVVDLLGAGTRAAGGHRELAGAIEQERVRQDGALGIWRDRPNDSEVRDRYPRGHL